MSDDPMPDRSMAHRDKIEWMIESAGWAFEPVGARVDTDPPQPPYGYTIGLEQAYGFPEVVVFGMTPANARESRPLLRPALLHATGARATAQASLQTIR